MKRLILILVMASLMVFTFGSLMATANDLTTPTYCSGCHVDGGKRFAIVDDWKKSNHAIPWYATVANTYCAKCHSPFQADPAVTSPAASAPVAAESWEGVNCYVCHTPRLTDANRNVIMSYQLGNYKVGSGNPKLATIPEELLAMYDLVYSWPAKQQLKSKNDLCIWCHNGKHQVNFTRLGERKMSKGVTCVGCHMAKLTKTYPKADGTFGPQTVANHDMIVTPAACITCHTQKTKKWAQSNMSKIHVYTATP